MWNLTRTLKYGIQKSENNEKMLLFCIFQTPKPLFDVFNLDYIPHYII